jgi:hypothetical protein
MEPILLSVLLLGALELFEAWWQRSETLFGVLERGFGYYQKSIFLFFLMHPAFYFIFFVVLATGKLNGWIVAILLLKTLDIFFKIALMRSIFLERKIDTGVEAVLFAKLDPWLFLTGVSLYPMLLYFALTG